MNEREVMKKSFSVLHASEHTIEEVLNMAENKHTDRNRQKNGKTILIAAAMVMALAATAFAADYVINHRDIFFFDTVESLATAQRTDNSEQAGSYAAPASAEENADMETVAEGVARKLEFGYYGDETVLSDETDDTPESAWERKKVTECLHDDYGRIINTYFTGETYAEKLVVEGLLDWDLSAMAERMAPDEDSQIVLTSRDAKALVMANALLGYTTDEGKRFQIEYQYDTEARYMEDTAYLLRSEYDDCYVYATSDQVEVLIEVYDGQIWASAVNAETGNAVYFYTTGCTTDEMEDLLDTLNLAVVMNAGA